MEIDLVIPYVNGNDPIWQKEYEPYREIKSGDEGNKEHRYRDYDTLKYLFRSIETYVPWIRKVFFIVSGPSQVPEWLDTTNPKLRIVYHKEYIPERFLPTFNANTIECFLWRIPDLSENFIYGNDDFFFLKELKPEHFFDDGKPRINIRFKTSIDKRYIQFCKITHNSLEFGLTGKTIKPKFRVETDHTFSPKRKSKMRKLFDTWGEKLYTTFTTVREDKNVNQYMFDVYEVAHRSTVPSNIKTTCIYVDDDLFVKTIGLDTICIQDKEISNFEAIKKKIAFFMDLYYPARSSFEKDILPHDKVVSIIIPTYNSADRIIPTLDTVKQQTYDNFECLIIDDGSTDNTAEVVKNYCTQDSRFKYIYKENGGVSSARNLGIEKASGDYICFSDDDDINLPERFETGVRYLEKYNENVIYGLIKKHKLNKKKAFAYFPWGYYMLRKENYEIFLNCPNVNPLFGKSEFIKQFRFTKAHLSEDVLFNIELFLSNRKIVALNKVLYLHIERQNSALTGAKKGKAPAWKLKETLEGFEEIINKYKSINLQDRIFLKTILNRHYLWWGKIFLDNKKYEEVFREIQDLVEEPKHSMSKNAAMMLKVSRV